MENKKLWIRTNASNAAGVIKALKNEGLTITNEIYKVLYDKSVIIYTDENNLALTLSLTSDKALAECVMNYYKEIQPVEAIKLTDKQPVWCKNFEEYDTEWVLRFYDADNKCTYTEDGDIGERYDQYEPYEGKLSEWAQI